MKKRLIFALAMVMTFCIGIGATLAYLSVSTQEVVNTFVYGDINITLTESETNVDDTDGSDANANIYKMIPGNTLDKNPTVTVKANSEDCYLFVRINESTNLDNYITYAISSDWKVLSGEGTNEIVIWREIGSPEVDQSFGIIGNKGFDGTGSFVSDKVLVNSTVTKQMMNAIDGIDTAGSEISDAAKAELAARPTLTFTAYAVQSANVPDAATAWSIAQNGGQLPATAE